MKLVRPLLAAASIFVLCTPASASPLCSTSTPGLQAYAAVQWTGGGDGDSNDAGCLINGDSTAPVVNVALTEHAYALAATAYGINAASVSGSLTPSGGTSYAAAWSIWTDTIQISGGTGAGQVTFGSHLSGTFTDHTQTNFLLAVNQGVGGNFAGATTSGIYSEVPGGTSSLSVDVTLPYTFTYDLPFTLTAWLDVSGYLNSLCCGGIDAQPPFSADFSHTAILDTVILAPGDSLQSLSGASYPAQATPVPEPAALVLVGTGLIGVARKFRKRGPV